MSISTKSTYSMRAMFELALHYNRGPLSVSYISRRQRISLPYLEQLLSRLRRRGLVKSVRGPKGGYMLSKKPKEITVGDVVRALDGNIAPLHCVNGKPFEKRCKMASCCVIKDVWKRLKKTMDDLLDDITLKDICNDAKKRGIDRIIKHRYTFHI